MLPPSPYWQCRYCEINARVKLIIIFYYLLLSTAVAQALNTAAAWHSLLTAASVRCVHLFPAMPSFLLCHQFWGEKKWQALSVFVNISRKRSNFLKV